MALFLQTNALNSNSAAQCQEPRNWVVTIISTLHCQELYLHTLSCGNEVHGLCILQPSNFCSFFLSLFFPPGMYFVRKTLTKLMSLLSLILIKYMAFLSFWNKKVLNGLPLHILWQFRNVLLEKKKKNPSKAEQICFSNDKRD